MASEREAGARSHSLVDHSREFGFCVPLGSQYLIISLAQVVKF